MGDVMRDVMMGVMRGVMRHVMSDVMRGVMEGSNEGCDEIYMSINFARATEEFTYYTAVRKMTTDILSQFCQGSRRAFPTLLSLSTADGSVTCAARRKVHAFRPHPKGLGPIRVRCPCQTRKTTSS